MSEKIKRIFGIDLGTTYSSIAYVDEYGKPVVVPNAENQHLTPSVVFFDEGNIVVGDIAKESAKIYPDEVVSFVKRSMGEPNFLFEYASKTYRAEEISSYIIRKVIQDAEQNLGEKITDILITCPAYFGINEREATKRAGEIAGYNVRQIINEPTAAAIAYGTAESSERKTVLVYDLGGGTFDITMIEIKPDAIEVICTGGDHNLGGKDWDDRIVSYLVEEFQKIVKTEEDILDDPDTCQELQLSAEKAKKILSQRDKTPMAVTHGGERVKIELEREKFEEITMDLLERTIAFTHEMLKEGSKKGYDKFDEIILVGGATRIPRVIERIKEEFSIDPKSFDPDESVAKGAAIYGWKLALNDGLIKKISENTGKTFNAIDNIIELTDTADVTQSQIQEAAQQVADETGYTLAAVENSNVKVKNVSSKSFGVIVRNRQNEELVFNLITRNTSVPVTTKKAFFTGIADQETVLIRIMENETSEKTLPPQHAIEIGTATLNLPNGFPADLPVEINFKLNMDGCLQINAVETSESRSVDITLDTCAVINGDELEEAKIRCQSLVVH
ncbi:MAG: Hsp70 family protein [Deltaproteobacteria bacterium]|nr:Hsp70 family protein [Deltaproteobacteria bacterium]